MSIVRALHSEYIFDIILRSEKNDYYDDEFLSYGGRIFRCPTFEDRVGRLDYYIRGTKLYRYTKKILRDNGPYYAVHCHDALESAVFLKAAFVENVPIRVVHSHFVFEIQSENKIAQLLDRRYMSMIKKYATRFLGVSDVANQTHFGENSDAKVVSAPYDETKFDPTRYPLRIKNNRINIIQVGQYCQNKNQLFTIDVFTEIVKIYPEAHLTFVGFDNIGFFPKITESISKNKLQDRVEFFPQDADIPKLLSQSDVFIFPSFTEGFGIAVVEAQAMGVKCYVSQTVPMTTDCGGCTFLDLNLGARYWAQEIVNDFVKSTNRIMYDCTSLSSANIKNQYYNLYSGLD